MKLRRPRPGPMASLSADVPQPHALTSPTNQTSLLVPCDIRFTSPTPRARPAPLPDLDAQVAGLRREVRCNSTTPVSKWIRLADKFKRQADQYHNTGDLEQQYLWILDELLHSEHSGGEKMDAEDRAHVAQLSRDAILEARHEQEGPSTQTILPSPKGRSPGRSSLRHSTPDAHDTPCKRVSFAVASDTAPSLPVPPCKEAPSSQSRMLWDPTLRRASDTALMSDKVRRRPWTPRLLTKDSMSFLGPVAAARSPGPKAGPTPGPAPRPTSGPIPGPAPGPAPMSPPFSPAPDRVRRNWLKAPSERRFLTADPPVTLSVPSPVSYSASLTSPSNGGATPTHTLMPVTSTECLRQVNRAPPASLRPGAPPMPRHIRQARTLRPVRLPRSLPTHFLRLAEAQLAEGCETCGLLLGHADPALSVTHLVLPPQSGTPFSCHAQGEEKVLEYQLQHGLITLGWIHTHPTQTCFLSSLDLHTQASYQALLPESIAVVCAPQHQPSVGVYRLTQPQGLQFVLQCKDQEPFHPHAWDGDESLYVDVSDIDAQVHWDSTAPLAIVDWRTI